MHHFRLKSQTVSYNLEPKICYCEGDEGCGGQVSLGRGKVSNWLSVILNKCFRLNRVRERDSREQCSHYLVSCTPGEQLEQCSRKGLRAADPSEKQGCFHNTKSHLFCISYWMLPNTLGTNVRDWFSPHIV